MNGKSIQVLMAAAVAAGMLAGCAGPKIVGAGTGQVVVGPNGVPVTKSPGNVTLQQPVKESPAPAVAPVPVAPTPAPVTPAPAPVAPAPVVNAAKGSEAAQIARASAVLEKMRVAIAPVEEADAADAELSRLLVAGVQGGLAAADYRVVAGGDSEIRVGIDVSSKLANQLGTRQVFKGDADVAVMRTPYFNAITQQQLVDVDARRRFDLKGEPAKAEDAMKALADKMAAVVAPWVAESCLKVGGKSTEICVVTIDNAWFLDSHADYPTMFVKVVKALPGVYDCTILLTDNVNRKIQARVVYDKDRYPDGLINRLYTIKELNISR